MNTAFWPRLLGLILANIVGFAVVWLKFSLGAYGYHSPDEEMSYDFFWHSCLMYASVGLWVILSFFLGSCASCCWPVREFALGCMLGFGLFAVFEIFFPLATSEVGNPVASPPVPAYCTFFAPFLLLTLSMLILLAVWSIGALLKTSVKWPLIVAFWFFVSVALLTALAVVMVVVISLVLLICASVGVNVFDLV